MTTSLTRRHFLATAAFAGVAHAQTSQQRGKELIGKVVQALGGDAFRNMPSRLETGRAYSFYREQLSGLSIAHIYTKYLPGEPVPGATVLRQVQRQTFGKKEDDAVLFTTKEAYEITYRGAKPLPETRFQQFQQSTLNDIFYILRMRLNEPGMAFESRGKEVVENQPAEAVDIFDAENRKVTVWVHASTFLPIKQSFQRWDAVINDRRDEVTRFSKFRDVGNRVMWPYNIQRERDTEKILELYSDQVKIGDNMPDSMFELPRGITILKK